MLVDYFLRSGYADYCKLDKNQIEDWYKKSLDEPHGVYKYSFKHPFIILLELHILETISISSIKWRKVQTS